MDITAIQNFLQQALVMHEYDLLKIAGAIVIGYITARSLKNLSLRFDQIPKDISKVVMPSDIEKKYNGIDDEIVDKLKFNEEIKNFIQVLKNSFDEEHLINLYNNINEVKVKDHTKDKVPCLLSLVAYGTYNNIDNTISIYSKDFINVIYHELFHLASHKDDNEVIYSGFCQTEKKGTASIIGDGLNEGYTEVLANRYFPNCETEDMSEAYTYLRLIAKKVEEIVGKEIMEGLYLDASLGGLVRELQKYTSDKEIMQFIADTDFINDHMKLDKTNHIAKIMIEKCISRINRFLIVCYANKAKEMVNQNELKEEELNYKINEFISTLASKIKTGNYKYKLMSDDNIKDYINESLEPKKR